jgi:anthranilate synthase/aminodeoxychorismate synthase-like glutamine amidotransferase
MLLIIDNYDSFTYNLYQSFAQSYPDVTVVRNDKITLDIIKQLPLKGMILSPGPGHPYESGICMDILKTLDFNYPLLGVCLGHQAIGASFGGQITQAPQIMHGKPDLIFHHHHHLYQDLPSPFQAGRYHSLIVDRQTLPENLCIEAENADGLIMGMRHRHLPIYGVQFHPESILTPDGNQLLKRFVQLCLEHK